MILATIRADATVASKVDCLLGSTGFTLVCEEATTLVFAGQHLVDFFDFDIAEVIFLAPSKIYHSAICCKSSFELKPSDTTIPTKSTFKQMTFPTERSV